MSPRKRIDSDAERRRDAAAAQSTCTYDTTSSCVVFTAPGMNYDQRVQDDCQGDGYRTDD